MERSAPLLFVRPKCDLDGRSLRAKPIVEWLTAPIIGSGQPVGTVWLMSHNANQQFDGCDLRLLNALSSLASANHRLEVAAENGESGIDPLRELHRVCGLLAKDLQVDRLLEEVLGIAIAISRSDFGCIQWYDPISGQLEIAAQRGFPDWWVDFWQTVRVGEGSCGDSIARGGRVIVEDVEQSSIFLNTPSLEVQRRAGVRGMQSTPLVNRKGKLLGVLSTHFRTPCRLDDRTLMMLDFLACVAVDLIDRASSEMALPCVEDRYRVLGDDMGAMIWSCHPSGIPSDPQPSWMKFTGQTTEEMVGDGWIKMLHPDDLGGTVAEWRESVRQCLPF